MSVIEVNPAKCKLCYACVRACPAKAIKIQKGHAEIIPERCINCGSCVTVCAPESLTYNDAKGRVKALLQNHPQVAAIAGPTISGEFVDISNYRSFVGMIKALGFAYVVEVAFGVDLVAHKYREQFNGFRGKYEILDNCPVVTSQVEKYYPEAVKNLSGLVTPWDATAQVVHHKYGKDVPVVYLSPCVAAKQQVKKYSGHSKITEVLSFDELRGLFAENEITETSVEFSEFDPPFGKKGSLFPIPEGILEAIGKNENLLDGDMITAEGKDDFLRGLKAFRYSSELKSHLNLFFCEGCVMGPGTSPQGDKYTRRSRVLHYARRRMQNFNEGQWQQNMDEYLNKLDFTREYAPNDQRLPVPTDSEIREELEAIGKNTAKDELGCGACGYPTCREFAIAVRQGLAKHEMCTYYSISSMRSFITKLNQTNKKLSQAESALRKSERKAREEHIAAKEALETSKTMLQKLPSAVVLVDENLRITDSNQSFIKLLGNDARELNDVIPGLVGADLKTLIPFYKYFSNVLMTGEEITNRDVDLKGKLVNVSVFTIHKNKIVGGIIRDLYSPEVQKDEVINRAKEVIKENLETVQQIAFLLGESASKTEKTLNSIIKSYKPGHGNS